MKKYFENKCYDYFDHVLKECPCVNKILISTFILMLNTPSWEEIY